MWKITHKRKNDTYINDEAMDIGVSYNNIYQFLVILDTVLDYFGHCFGNILSLPWGYTILDSFGLF